MPRASSRSKNWTRSPGDLHLDLALGAQPRRALEDSLREAIRSGRLPVGAGLPSTRALAADLGISRGTVVEAYAQLTAEGWIASQPRSGTVVAGSGQPPSTPSVPAGAPRTPAELDLRPGNNDLSTFPRSAWLSASRRALARAPHSAFGYGDHRGRPELREELAAYLARTRGVRVSPDCLVVTTGFTQGLNITARALATGGTSQLAVENPCLPDCRDTAEAAGLRTHPIAVDAAGLDVDVLRRSTARAVLVSPARQFPLGVCLSPARRTELLAWARAGRRYIIEDDYDGEFRYDRQPVGALQGLDPGRVVYAGTVAKTLSPGVRLGWLAVPERLLDAVVAQKRLTDGQTSTLTQLTMAELLRGGAYDRHIRRMRRHYRHRRDLLLRALARHAPHIAVTGISAGLSVAITLPAGRDERTVIDRAAGHGLALTGLTTHAYYTHGTGPSRGQLVISYATPPEHAYADAVAVLAELLAGLAFE